MLLFVHFLYTVPSFDMIKLNIKNDKVDIEDIKDISINSIVMGHIDKDNKLMPNMVYGKLLYLFTGDEEHNNDNLHFIEKIELDI